MKTKTIPFDLETAKKIQAGEIEGRIMCNNAEANIIDLDMHFRGKKRICAQTLCNDGKYHTNIYNEGGTDFDTGYGLYIELQVPDNEPKEPQFKPFDKVLVRCSAYNYTCWQAAFYSHYTKDKNDDKHHVTTSGAYYMDNEILPYEGNEHLVGTTDKPKEIC